MGPWLISSQILLHITLTLFNTQMLGHTPGASDVVGQGLGLRTCISNRFPVGADAPVPGTVLGNRSTGLMVDGAGGARPRKTSAVLHFLALEVSRADL